MSSYWQVTVSSIHNPLCMNVLCCQNIPEKSTVCTFCVTEQTDMTEKGHIQKTLYFNVFPESYTGPTISMQFIKLNCVRINIKGAIPDFNNETSSGNIRFV